MKKSLTIIAALSIASCVFAAPPVEYKTKDPVKKTFKSTMAKKRFGLSINCSQAIKEAKIKRSKYKKADHPPFSL